jgi:hypothetical protein
VDLLNLCCNVCSKIVYFTSLCVLTSPVFDNCTYNEIGHSTKLHISFHNISTLFCVCVCALCILITHIISACKFVLRLGD